MLITQLQLLNRELLLARVDRITEPVLLLLAFSMVPLIAGPFLWELSTRETAVFGSVGFVIWLVFLADLILKLVIAPNRVAYLRGHWIDVVVVAVPVFRPLLIVRLFVFGSRAILGLRRMAEADFVFALAGGIVLVGATVMFSVDAPYNPQLNSFGDALWWSMVTVTTVGYGDIVPATVPGRIVALFSMAGGIALFGAIAANLAAFLTRSAPRTNRADRSLDSSSALQGIQAEMNELRQELSRLRAGLSRLESDSR